MKKLIKSYLLLIVFLLVSGLSIGQETETLLQTDFDGKVTNGSIENLIRTIKQGNSIRIGWKLDFNDDGIGDLEHWVDANFLSILNRHVFNQIKPIYAQSPNMKTPQIEINNSPMQWTAVIGTNGKLISRYIYSELDKIEDENFRKQMEMMLKINEEMVETIWVKVK